MPDGDMGQRFTNPATRVIHFAQEEAKRMGVTVVGTEHLLLGLVRERDGVAARVLERLGATLDTVRAEAARTTKSKKSLFASKKLTLSPECKTALEHALREARELNPQYGLLDFVDTEHLLLGLLDAGAQSKARKILDTLHVDPLRLRAEVIKYFHLVTDPPVPDPPPPVPKPARETSAWDRLYQQAMLAAMQVEGCLTKQDAQHLRDRALSAAISAGACIRAARRCPLQADRTIEEASSFVWMVLTWLDYAVRRGLLNEECREALVKTYDDILAQMQRLQDTDE
jgi:ATP-dependent Clp protease ATP-binding subunit ClpA